MTLLSRINTFLRPAVCGKVFDPDSTDTDSLMSSVGANWSEYYCFDKITTDNQEWYQGAFSGEPVDPGLLSTDENDKLVKPDPIRFAYEVKRIGPQRSIYVMADTRFLARILWYQASKKVLEGALNGDVCLPAEKQGSMQKVFSIKYLLNTVFTKIRAESEWTHPLINVWMPTPETMNTEGGEEAAIRAFKQGLMKDVLGRAADSGWQQPSQACGWSHITLAALRAAPHGSGSNDLQVTP